MSSRLKRILFFFLIIFAPGPCVFAQAQFRIIPPIIELEVGRGGTKVFSFELANDNKEKPVRFKIYAQDFDVDREGNTQFIETGKTERSCSQWITIEQNEVVLEPGKSKKITAKVALPASLKPGGYYSAVLCELVTEAPRVESGALIKWRIASLVKVSVLGGRIEKKATLEDFFLRTIFEPGQERSKGLTFVATVKNEGNIHITTEGKVTVLTKNKSRKGEARFDVGTGTILPGHIRDFSATYDKFITEGEYIARATFRYAGATVAEREVPFSVSVATPGEAKEGMVRLVSLKLVPEEVNLNVPAGAFRTAGFSIQNQRLEPIKVKLAVDSEGGMAGWFTVDPQELTVEAGKEAKVFLRINLPAAIQDGAYKTKINLTPQLASGQVSAEQPEPVSFKINIDVPKR